MTYEEFIEYCTSLVLHRMTRSTAEHLIGWMFPEGHMDMYEKKLAESSEFITYATKVLVGDVEFTEEEHHK